MFDSTRIIGERQFQKGQVCTCTCNYMCDTYTLYVLLRYMYIVSHSIQDKEYKRKSLPHLTEDRVESLLDDGTF